MQEGLRDLQRWLADLAREGWGAHADDSAHFEAMARRLVDAQAPGLAARVRALASAATPAEAARRVGSLHLLLCAFERLEQLEPPLAADVLSLLGVSTPKKKVLAEAPPVEDRWWVLGALVDEEEELTVRRTWLIGQSTGRIGLILDFAPPRGQLPAGLPAGRCLDGPVCFYPSAAPLRCLLAGSGEELVDPPPRPEGLEAWLQPLGSAWAADRRRRTQLPWLGRSALGLADVRVETSEEGSWAVTDGAAALPLVDGSEAVWGLLAATGGRGGVWGELDRDRLRPLAALREGQLIPLEDA